MTIDIYGMIAVGSALVIGAIPLMYKKFRERDALLSYIDNRTGEERRQDRLHVKNVFYNIKGEVIYK